MLADFVILAEDPHDVPKLELERIDVEMVFVGGVLEVCAPAVVTLCPAGPEIGRLPDKVPRGASLGCP